MDKKIKRKKEKSKKKKTKPKGKQKEKEKEKKKREREKEKETIHTYLFSRGLMNCQLDSSPCPLAEGFLDGVISHPIRHIVTEWWFLKNKEKLVSVFIGFNLVKNQENRIIGC